MYQIHPIVDGFPGKSATHGAFGWSSVHLLRGDGRTILVETGPPAYVPLLTAGLGQLGLTPDDVTDVLLTHSHWDHLSNIMMFPRARPWIGAAELAWAGGLPVGTPHQSSLHIAELHSRGSAVGLVGEADQVAPGITVLATPGHTPGHVAYSVETTAGDLVFAGDAVKNAYELSSLEVDMTLDAAASRATIERLREHMQDRDAVLVPGHDVPLRVRDGTVARVGPQQAQITFFATATDGPEDRSIADRDSGEPTHQ